MIRPNSVLTQFVAIENSISLINSNKGLDSQ